MTNSHTHIKHFEKNVLLGLQSNPDIAPLIQNHPHKAAVPYFIVFQYTAKLDTTPQISMNKEWHHVGVWFPYYT
jgi:hypothetical protein